MGLRAQAAQPEESENLSPWIPSSGSFKTASFKLSDSDNSHHKYPFSVDNATSYRITLRPTYSKGKVDGMDSQAARDIRVILNILAAARSRSSIPRIRGIP